MNELMQLQPVLLIIIGIACVAGIALAIDEFVSRVNLYRSARKWRQHCERQQTEQSKRDAS